MDDDNRRNSREVGGGDSMPATGQDLIGLDQESHRCKALKIAEETLKRRRRLIGDEHSDTIRTMFILASTYTKFRRCEEAVALCIK